MPDRYWVGGTGNWNDTAHWSTTSGGAGGATVPADGDTVIIDNNSATADFTIYIDVDTANLYKMDTSGCTSRILTIIQNYDSTLGRCKRFNCYYGTIRATPDYLNGGLITGTSTTSYSKVRWQKGSNGTKCEMYLTRFAWYGNMTSTDDGFKLVSGSIFDAFDIHIYGTDCRKVTMAFSYTMNLYIHTPKTVAFTHSDGSGTWYGCDVSYSQWVIGVVNTLYIYSNCKLCCDMTDHGGFNAQKYGLYMSPTTAITLETGAELDVGITYEGATAGQTYTMPLTTFPRFFRWQGLPANGTIYINNDITVSGTYASYIAFAAGYTTGAQYTVNMLGHAIKAPKTVVGAISVGLNDVSLVLNHANGQILQNVGAIKSDNILMGSTSNTNVNKIDLSNTTLLDNYANNGGGANITIYSGNGNGSIIDATNCTGTLYINGLTMSDTTYTQPMKFYAPSSGTWIQKGNINFGSKAIFYNNNGTMTLGANVTFANTSTNSHFNKINFGNYVLTVNNKLEFYNSNVSDSNIALGTGAWAVCKNANGVANEYWVWGSPNWSTPQAYPLTSNPTPSDGITVDIRKPSSGSTLFTFDTDNIGLKRIIVRQGCTYRVVTNVDVYAQDLTDYGTLYRGAGYYGYIHYGGGMTPFNYKQLELPKKLDRTVMEFMKVMD